MTFAPASHWKGLTQVATKTAASSKIDIAWVAAQRFQMLIPQLTSFATTLVGRKVTVAMSGMTNENFSTAEDTIYLAPPIELGFDLPHDVNQCDRVDTRGYQKCPACGVRENITVNLYHEISHIAFGTFKDPASGILWASLNRFGIKKPRALGYNATVVEAAARINPILGSILNSIEDVRVDAAMYEARPGLRRMGFMSDRTIVEDGYVSLQGELLTWDSQPLDAQAAIMPYFMGKYDHLVGGKFAPELYELARMPKFKRLAAQVRECKTVTDSFVLAVKFFAFFKENGYFISPAEFVPPPPLAGDSDESENNDESQEQQDEAGTSDDKSDDDSPEDGSSESDKDDGANDSDSPDGDEKDQDTGPSDSDGDGSDEPSEGSDSPDSGSDVGPEEGESTQSTDNKSDDDNSGSSDLGDAVPDSQHSEASGTESSGLDQNVPDEPGQDEGDPDQGESGTGECGESGNSGESGEPGEPGGWEQLDESSESEQSGESAESGESGESRDSTQPGERGQSEESTESAESGESGDGGDSSRSGETDNESTADGQKSKESSGQNQQDGDDSTDEGTEGTPTESSFGASDSGSGTASGSPANPVASDVPADLAPDRADDTGDPTADHGDPSADPVRDDTRPGIDTPPEPELAERPPQTYEEHEAKHGTPDDVKAAVEAILGHSTNHERHRADQDIAKAVKQAEHFDSPSEEIAGVHELDWVDDKIAHHLGMSEGEEKLFYDEAANYKVAVGLFNHALMRMRHLLEENKRTGHERNKKRGRVNPRSLAKRAPFNDPRVFQQTLIPKTKDYAVIIGVDSSGSTYYNDRMLNEKNAVHAQADLLHKLGIPFKIVAHTGAEIKNPVTRQNETHLIKIVVKNWNDPWNRRAIERLNRLLPVSANLDGHALEMLRKDIEKIKAEKRLIMYYSDGAMPMENFAEELKLIHRELEYCKKNKIALAAVGIDSTDPMQYGIPMVLYKGDSDIISVVEHVANSLSV
jgi:hypothetical protein